jgi:hypothetical protein
VTGASNRAFARREPNKLDCPRVVKVSSDSGVKLEQAADSVATVNGSALRRYFRRREEEEIAFALMVPFKMMMIDVFRQCPT